MKVRAEIIWSKNDNWETPDYIMDWVKEKIFNFQDYFDPCPLATDAGGGKYVIQFDGLEVDWAKRNYVNPPYNITDKPRFVKKAFDEYKKWNMSVLLIPSTTETKWFHDYLVGYAWIYFVKGRVKFKGYNSKGYYVTDKTGQSGSMICVLDPDALPFMTTLDIEHV